MVSISEEERQIGELLARSGAQPEIAGEVLVIVRRLRLALDAADALRSEILDEANQLMQSHARSLTPEVVVVRNLLKSAMKYESARKRVD